MAGSYRHATNDDGSLRSNEDFAQSVENLGDAYELAEEMYGMIWYLAAQLAASPATGLAVETARRNYKLGLDVSPGVAR